MSKFRFLSTEWREMGKAAVNVDSLAHVGPGTLNSTLALGHDFYEVDYLPENDRTRYTIHPEARKEILKRLLQLNHKLYAEEEAKGLHKKKAGKKAKTVESGDQNQPTLI